ncbi:mutator type transposase [Tanacetum coccineum]
MCTGLKKALYGLKQAQCMILTAVGVDPNNGTYPLAYAVVEAETKDSWNWFLDCLGDDLELTRNSNFTFISDRQQASLIRPMIRRIDLNGYAVL